MNTQSSLPSGALHDPRAPFNDPDTFCPSCHPEAVLEMQKQHEQAAEKESEHMEESHEFEAVHAKHDAEFELWKQDNLRLCRDHS